MSKTRKTAETKPEKPKKVKRMRPRPRESMSVEGVQRRLWTSVCDLERVIRSTDDVQTRIRAAHALSQAASSLVKITESVEFEQRLRRLEEKMQQSIRNGDPRYRHGFTN